MEEKTDVVDNRLHIKLKHHIVKHWKRLHSHIKRHHKKYFFWSALYGIFHLSFFHILAVKFLWIKLVLSVFGFLGIYNHSLNDIFAKMDNICIDKQAVIVGQSCENNFDSIQDAVRYLESMIDPETDTIYNAQYYGVIKSLLGEYCKSQIDKQAIASETKTLNDIAKLKNISQKIISLKEVNAQRKEKSLLSDFETEGEFCQNKYLAYDMLDMSQSLFIKQLKRSSLLSPSPLLTWQNLTKKSDKLIFSSFASWKKMEDTRDIQSSLWDLQSKTAITMATIIKNISLSAAQDALDGLEDIGALSSREKKDIASALEIRFVQSCGKNQWYHKIKKYYIDKVWDRTTLEEIKLDIWLCNSYQYIDQLDQQIKKLLIHEIGHYMYYFKDESSKNFESICRLKKWSVVKNTCDRDEFVSNYSQTNAEEDYAETFSRWALTQINQDKKYLKYYREDSDQEEGQEESDDEDIILDSHQSATSASDENAIFNKFKYFDGLVKSTRVSAMK